jgi:hypothetical protein
MSYNIIMYTNNLHQVPSGKEKLKHARNLKQNYVYKLGGWYIFYGG